MIVKSHDSKTYLELVRSPQLAHFLLCVSLRNSRASQNLRQLETGRSRKQNQLLNVKIKIVLHYLSPIRTCRPLLDQLQQRSLSDEALHC